MFICYNISLLPRVVAVNMYGVTNANLIGEDQLELSLAKMMIVEDLNLPVITRSQSYYLTESQKINSKSTLTHSINWS